ncbi:Ig-like domain-containing protein [Halobaculum lipolyticum]|uniref:Ig-like domain-containing protein n=1 Tax=Halobaculum lipolyticum TaxID=3032001 RepID=A0ABD5W8X5_9EURY|nr:Ig-like domain-containing protein [Halobaculum sp. DT31]
MTDRGDGAGDRDRAVTVQIGAVILFGFLIVALSMYQATVVPDQNREVEFLHNQEVQTDVVELSDSVAAAGRVGSAAPQTVKLGTRYPSRAFFVNPPPATGRLSTNRSAADVSLSNVSVLRPDGAVDDEANDYWNDTEPVEFDTAFLVYEPRYNNYREAPTTRYESGVVFNRFPSGSTLNVTDQRLVDGDRITLVVVKGDLSASGVDATSVDPSAVSVVTRRERIAGGATITVPSTRGANVWRGPELLNVSGNPYVDDVVDAGDGRVSIQFDETRNTSLGVAVVDVGDGADTVAAPDPAYLSVERAPSVASNGTTREVVVEVRDRYGNPVDDATVSASATNDGTFATGTLATGEDGLATFEYTPGDTGTEELRFGTPDLTGFDADEPLDANVSVEVNAGAAGAGDGGATDPNPPDSVVLVDSFRKNQTTAVLQLENRGTETVNSSAVRINFFSDGGGQTPTYADLISASESPRLDIAGPSENATIEFEPGQPVNVCYVFDESLRGDEFFVSTYAFDAEFSEQYFVGLTDSEDVQCGGSAGDGGDGGDGGGTPPSVQNGIEYDGNLGSGGSGSAVVFDVTNTNSQTVRINRIEVESRIGDAQRIWDTDGPGQFGYEVYIPGGQNTGFAEAGNPQNFDPGDAAFTADGSTISLSSNAVLAGSGGADSATVTVGDFGRVFGNGNNFDPYDFGTLDRVGSGADWDVSVTLRFQSLGDVTFYFREA